MNSKTRRNKMSQADKLALNPNQELVWRIMRALAEKAVRERRTVGEVALDVLSSV